MNLLKQLGYLIAVQKVEGSGNGMKNIQSVNKYVTWKITLKLPKVWCFYIVLRVSSNSLQNLFKRFWSLILIILHDLTESLYFFLRLKWRNILAVTSCNWNKIIGSEKGKRQTRESKFVGQSQEAWQIKEIFFVFLFNCFCLLIINIFFKAYVECTSSNISCGIIAEGGMEGGRRNNNNKTISVSFKCSRQNKWFLIADYSPVIKKKRKYK